jgi:uncharacterized protein YndB with AHSA1/START domain
VKADIIVDTVYDHPIDRVWAALTSSEALSAYLDQLAGHASPVPDCEHTRWSPWRRPAGICRTS